MGCGGPFGRATLQQWLTDPLTGTGPGSFSSAFTLSGFFSQYNGIGRHADNALVQVLMEAGVLGLGSVGLLATALLNGLRIKGWGAPAAALGLFAGMALTDNPSDSAHLVVIVIAWFALLAPAEATTAAPVLRRRWMLAPTALGAGVVAVVVALNLGASLAYDAAVAAAGREDAAGVRSSLRLATNLDPASALYRRNLAVWLLADGRTAEAVPEIELAIALNPGDATSLRVGAMVASMLDQPGTAKELARRAAEMRTLEPANPLMLAYTAAAGGSDAEARAALVTGLRWNPWLTGDPAWRAAFDSDARDLIHAGWESVTNEPDATGRLSSAMAILAAMADRQVSEASISEIDAATAAVIACDLNGAEQKIDGLSQSEADSSGGLLARILDARATGDASDEEVTLGLLRSPLLGLAALTEVSAASPLVGPEEDARLYSRTAIPAPAFGPRFPTFASGLSAWLHDPRAAARIGAPGSGLATCE